MGYYDIVNDFSSPYRHHDRIIPDYARVVQDVPIQTHVAPPAPVGVDLTLMYTFTDNTSPKVIDAFNNDVQQAAGGPALALLNEVPHHPAPNGRASEVLRQLSLVYLNDPNSRLTMVRMGPDHANEVTVDITLKLTNL